MVMFHRFLYVYQRVKPSEMLHSAAISSASSSSPSLHARRRTQEGESKHSNDTMGLWEIHGPSWHLLTHQFFCKIYVKWGKNGWEIQWKSNIIQGRSASLGSCSISTGSDLQQVLCNAWDRDRKASSGHRGNSGKWMIITYYNDSKLRLLGFLG